MTRFVIAKTILLESLGLNVDTNRKSLDGVWTMYHIEPLPDEILMSIVESGEFAFKSQENLDLMLETVEWKVGE